MVLTCEILCSKRSSALRGPSEIIYIFKLSIGESLSTCLSHLPLKFFGLPSQHTFEDDRFQL
jgi:hypothetical protein